MQYENTELLIALIDATPGIKRLRKLDEAAGADPYVPRIKHSYGLDQPY